MQFLCSIPSGTLRGALKIAATKDIRYYLCGVHVESCDGKLYVVSCDGHRLFVADISNSERTDQGNWSLILPAELLKTTLKAIGKAGFLNLHGDLSVSGNGKPIELRLGELAFGGKSVDGVFPDWRRVVPATDAQTDLGQTAYDPGLLLGCHEALAEHNNMAKTKVANAGFLLRLDSGRGVILGTSPSAFCVLMARRDEQRDFCGWFNPAYPMKTAA